MLVGFDRLLTLVFPLALTACGARAGLDDGSSSACELTSDNRHQCELNMNVVSMRSDGSALLAGDALGEIEIGGRSIATRGFDALLVHVDPSGDLTARVFGDGASQYFDSVALDASGRAIVTGVTAGDLDLGSAGVIEAGCPKCERAFVARLDP